MNKIMQIVIILLVAAASFFILTGCSDTQSADSYYNKAIIMMHDGTRIEIEVQDWSAYDSKTKIVAKDGTVYLTSTYNVMLIREE